MRLCRAIGSPSKTGAKPLSHPSECALRTLFNISCVDALDEILAAMTHYWPLHELVPLLRNRADHRQWSSVVSACLRDFKEVNDERLDLRLFVCASPRSSEQMSPDGRDLGQLLPEVVERFDSLLEHNDVPRLRCLLGACS